MSKRRKPIVLAVVSDTHCNSTVGLCPPRVRLEDGGVYEHSDAQRWLWDNYLDFAARVEARVREVKGELQVLVNGDSVDGNHHQTTQIVSGNLGEVQEWIALETFNVLKVLGPTKWWWTKGTPAHVGEGAAFEQAIARHYRAEQCPDTGAWARDRLRLDVHGVKIDAQHHVSGIGRLPWTDRGGVARLATRTFVRQCEYAARRGIPIPTSTVLLRSHIHAFHDSGPDYPVRVIVTPAWQLCNSFAYRITPEGALADVGGVILTVWPDSRYEVQPVRYAPDLPTEVVA